MNRGALLFACAMLSTRLAAADTLTIDGAEPAERGSEWYVSDSLDYRGGLRPAVGLLGDWSYGPLFLRDEAGNRRAELLTDRIVARVGGTLVFADRFRVGLHLPMALYDTHGEARPGTFREPSGPSFGDLRLSFSTRLIGRYGDLATLALGVRSYLPTGSRDDSMSDGTLRMEPHLMFAGRWRAVVYAASVGWQVRPARATFAGRELGSEASFSAALGVKINDRVVFGPEIFGRTVVAGEDPFAVRGSPLEALIGGHLRLSDDVTIGSSIGRRITRAELAPSMRVLFVLDYAPDYCVDKDGDGICATEDACPEADGPRSTDPKTSGCPLDSDGDGVLDREDACPNTPGVKSAAPEGRGCPSRAPTPPN